MNIHELGQFLYESYCTHTEWKSAVTGAALPPWISISPGVQTAWMATARALMDQFNVTRKA